LEALARRRCMALITQYVKNLAAFMVFASVCTIVMPNGRIKGMIGFVMGLMLMLIILKPVGSVIGCETDTIFSNNVKLSSYAIRNEEAYGDATELILREFEASCSELLCSKLGVRAADVCADSGEEGVYISSITVDMYGYGGTVDELKMMVSSICGVDESIITVINADEGEYNEAD
jgi:stage III sporulation protein AF